MRRRLADEFREFQIFDMRGNVMEYEANLFAAQIAMATASDIYLVALKVSELSRRGYAFRSMATGVIF